MICKYCRSDNLEDSKWCSACGKKITTKKVLNVNKKAILVGSSITFILIGIVIFNWVDLKLMVYSKIDKHTEIMTMATMYEDKKESRAYKSIIKTLVKEQTPSGLTYVVSVYAHLEPKIQEAVAIELKNVSYQAIETALISAFGGQEGIGENLSSVNNLLKFIEDFKFEQITFSTQEILDTLIDWPDEDYFLTFISKDTLKKTLRAEVEEQVIPLHTMIKWAELLSKYQLIESTTYEALYKEYETVKIVSQQYDEIIDKRKEIEAKIQEVDEQIEEQRNKMEDKSQEAQELEAQQAELGSKIVKLESYIEPNIYVVNSLGKHHYEIADVTWNNYFMQYMPSGSSYILKSDIDTYSEGTIQSMRLYYKGYYPDTQIPYYEEVSYIEIEKLPQYMQEVDRLTTQIDKIYEERRLLESEIPVIKDEAEYQDLQNQIYNLKVEQDKLFQTLGPVEKEIRNLLSLEEAKHPDKLTVVTPELSKTQIKQLLKDAFDVKYETTNGYVENYMDDQNVPGYWPLREEINTYEKMRNYLSVYWSSSYIDKYLECMKPFYREVNGKLYSPIGDPPLDYDYNEALITQIQDEGTKKSVLLDVSDPYGGTQIVTIEFILNFTEQGWILENEGDIQKARAKN